MFLTLPTKKISKFVEIVTKDSLDKRFYMVYDERRKDKTY